MLGFEVELGRGSGDSGEKGRAIKITPMREMRPAKMCRAVKGTWRKMEQAQGVRRGMRRLITTASETGRYFTESGEVLESLQ